MAMEALRDTTMNSCREHINIFHTVEVGCNKDWLHSVFSCNEVVAAFSVKNYLASNGITCVTPLFIAMQKKRKSC